MPPGRGRPLDPGHRRGPGSRRRPGRRSPQGTAVAVKSGPAGPQAVRAADGGDPPVPEFDEVPGSGHAALEVRGADRADGCSVRLRRRVDDNQGHVLVLQLAQHRLAGQVQHAQCARGPPGHGRLKPARELLLGRDAADDHADLSLGGRGDRAANQFVCPQAAQPADQEVDHADPGPGRDLIALLPQEPADAFPGARRDVGAPVEHLGHRRDRDARGCGDAREAGCPRGGHRHPLRHRSFSKSTNSRCSQKQGLIREICCSNLLY